MIYFLYAPELDRVKIGHTRSEQTIKKRISTLKTSCPCSVFLIAVFKGDASRESFLHKRFTENRVHGEWFQMSKDLSYYIHILSPYKNFLNEGFLKVEISQKEKKEFIEREGDKQRAWDKAQIEKVLK